MLRLEKLSRRLRAAELLVTALKDEKHGQECRHTPESAACWTNEDWEPRHYCEPCRRRDRAHHALQAARLEMYQARRCWRRCVDGLDYETAK